MKRKMALNDPASVSLRLREYFSFFFLVNNLLCSGRFLHGIFFCKNKTHIILPRLAVVDYSLAIPPLVISMVTTCNVQSLPPPGGGDPTITPPCSPPGDIMEIEEGELLDDTPDLDEIR